MGGGVLLDEPPAVPDGLLLRAMYPKRPESELPHFSSGYPGQFSLQLPTDVVVPGAIFVHQHDWYCTTANAYSAEHVSWQAPFDWYILVTTPKLEPVFWLEQYCCTRPSTWVVMARARTAARKQKLRKGSMLCIFFISPGGICGSARAAAGEEPRNNTAPSPAYCAARSEGMQRAVAMGVDSSWLAERRRRRRRSVSSRCKRRATEVCSGERGGAERRRGEATGGGGDGIILSVNSVVAVLVQQVEVRWQ